MNKTNYGMDEKREVSIKEIKNSKHKPIPLILLVLSIVLLSLIIFRKFLFGGYYFFTKGILSDLLRANLPTYYGLYDAFKSGGIWSWSMGIGDTIFTHADVLGDPFTYIIFLGGRAHIPDMFIWHFLIKLVFEGITCYFYLFHFKISRIACVYGSVLYVFSGFSLIAGSNFALGTICVYFPLILLGIEKFLENEKSGLLVISLVLTAIYSYYFFYISGILAAIYMSVRLIMMKSDFKRAVSKLFKLLSFGILAVLAAAFIMLPQLGIVLGSSRAGSGTDTEFSLGLLKFSISNFFTIFSRSFNLNLLGDRTTNEYYGAYFDYFQLSSVFVTSASFILYGQYFAYADRRKRKWFIIISGLTAVLLCIPFFAFLTNAFITINYRWEYIVSVIAALGCALGLDTLIKNKKFNRKYLYATMAVSVLFLGVAVRYFYMSNNLRLTEYAVLPAISVITVFITVIIIDFLTNRLSRPEITANRKRFACSFTALLVAAVSIFEIAYNYSPLYSDDTEKYGYKKDEAVYFDESYEIINKIKSDDSGFYRIYKDFDSVVDKNKIDSCNDAMAQNYYGLKNYSSVNNSNYIDFLIANNVDLGITNYRLLQNFHLVYQGDGNYKIYDGNGKLWTASKAAKGTYTIKLKKENSSDSQLWKLKKQWNGSYHIISVKNNLYISLKDGEVVLRNKEPEKFIVEYQYKCYVELSEEASDSSALKEGFYTLFLKTQKDACLTCDSENKRIKVGAKVDFSDYAKGQMLNYINDIGDNLDLISFLGVKYYLTKNKDAVLPDYFEFLYESGGIYVYLNTSYYPLAFTASAVTSSESFAEYGEDERNEALLGSTVVDGASDDALLGENNFEERQAAFSLTSFNNDRVTAEISVPEGAKYLNFSIPYSKNWKVYIDGKSVNAEKVNVGLLGVKTDESMLNKTVSIELRYIPREFYLGIAVSMITAALCAVYFVIKRIRSAKIGR